MLQAGFRANVAGKSRGMRLARSNPPAPNTKRSITHQNVVAMIARSYCRCWVEVWRSKSGKRSIKALLAFAGQCQASRGEKLPLSSLLPFLGQQVVRLNRAVNAQQLLGLAPSIRSKRIYHSRNLWTRATVNSLDLTGVFLGLTAADHCLSWST